jgi:LytS/YehU family sensor histidine kinase
MPWTWLYTITPTQIFPFFSMLPICGIAAAIMLLKKWHFENEKNRQIEREKMGMELEMLKAQVHPHFLFNTLNNLYSLTLTKSQNAPLVVTHLSELLRYMLYECNEQEVPLDKEIAAIRKYVELEKLRYGPRLDVSLSCSGELSQLKIAPLILLPFIENSFKHGVSKELDQCWINLHIHADNNNLSFNLSNSCFNDKLSVINGGIGLQNIQKRLTLLYDGKYSLNNTHEEEIYLVRLTMQLNFRSQVNNQIQASFPNSVYSNVYEI